MKYQNHLCLRCNTNFVYYDGWHCKCESTESLQKIIEEIRSELPIWTSTVGTYTLENIPKRVKLLVEEYKFKEKIINDTLRALPVGNINTHTPDTIPERVQDWVNEAAEECSLREKWEELADKLIVFAEIVREVEGNATRNTEYYNSAYEAIEQYEKLKDGNR